MAYHKDVPFLRSITMLIKLAVLMDKFSKRIKIFYNKKLSNKFLKKYNLKDDVLNVPLDRRYNPYECTNFCLMQTLVDSNIIKKNDYILDVGCGSGIFLIFLACNGFNHLYGVEYDKVLFDLCVLNKTLCKKEVNQKIEVYNIDALKFNIPDEINCFYLYNTFFDEQTYINWLNNVYESLQRHSRNIQIILLFRTVASLGAFEKCKWLHIKTVLKDERQFCSRCVNYVIYTNEEQND